jgi:hypothetical protein
MFSISTVAVVQGVFTTLIEYPYTTGYDGTSVGVPFRSVAFA